MVKNPMVGGSSMSKPLDGSSFAIFVVVSWIRDATAIIAVETTN